MKKNVIRGEYADALIKVVQAYAYPNQETSACMIESAIPSANGNI